MPISMSNPSPLTSADNSHPCCPICMDTFSNNRSVVITECNHTFDAACLNRWLEGHSNCPLCRQPIYGRNITLMSQDQVNSLLRGNNSAQSTSLTERPASSESALMNSLNSQLKDHIRFPRSNSCEIVIDLMSRGATASEVWLKHALREHISSSSAYKLKMAAFLMEQEVTLSQRELRAALKRHMRSFSESNIKLINLLLENGATLPDNELVTYPEHQRRLRAQLSSPVPESPETLLWALQNTLQNSLRRYINSEDQDDLERARLLMRQGVTLPQSELKSALRIHLMSPALSSFNMASFLIRQGVSLTHTNRMVP